MMRVGPLVFAVLLISSATVGAAAPRPAYGHRRAHHHALAKKAGWAGAGLAAGEIAGPAGSAGVGAAKYRNDLKAGGHKRTRALVKIGAPIGAGLVAGPAGSGAYEVYDHRHWIKRHVLHTSDNAHKRKRPRRR